MLEFAASERTNSPEKKELFSGENERNIKITNRCWPHRHTFLLLCTNVGFRHLLWYINDPIWYRIWLLSDYMPFQSQLNNGFPSKTLSDLSFLFGLHSCISKPFTCSPHIFLRFFFLEISTLKSFRKLFRSLDSFAYGISFFFLIWCYELTWKTGLHLIYVSFNLEFCTHTRIQ